MSYGVTLVFIAALAITSTAEARCGPRLISLWVTPAPVLPTRPEIVLSGRRSGESLDTYASRIHWVSDSGGRIGVEVLRQSVGDVYYRQLWLRPSEPLTVGVGYRLRVGPRWHRHGRETARWTVAAAVTAPRWLARPTVGTPQRVRLGCGPAIDVPFETAVQGGESIRYRVEVWEEGETRRRTFDVFGTSSEFSIGRGMCAGPLSFPTGTRIHLRVALVDSGGTESWVEGPYSLVFP